MVIFWRIFWLLMLFLYKIPGEMGSSVADTDPKQLEKNLRVLRNDFNKLVETVEDFAGDFLVQMHEAGKLMENTYIDQDYNWQDDDSNTIDKTTKHAHSSLTTITGTPQTIFEKGPKLSRLLLPKIPGLISKDIKQDVSNDIKKRIKRSTQMPKEFGNRPPVPMMMQDGHMIGRMPENVGQISDKPIMHELPPYVDRISNIREVSRNEDNFLDNNQGQRSSAPTKAEFTEFADNTNFQKDKKQLATFLEAPQSAQEPLQGSDGVPIIPTQKPKDPLICAAKTQKEMNLERQKMEELKEEVKKLNEVVALLKDQQKVIKMFNDVDLDNNDISDGQEDLENNIKNSFLYKTLRQLQNNRKNGALNTLQSLGKTTSSNMEAKSTKHDTQDNQIMNPGPTFKDLENIKNDLGITAENLNKTKELLAIEKKREEELEQELRRQRSELKFLKVMTESLYDKMSQRNEDIKDKYRIYEHNSKLRNSDFKDMDVDSLLESVHTPKTMPTPRKIYSGAPALPEFFPKSDTRESIPGDNGNTNMHELLSRLNHQKNPNENNENINTINSQEMNQAQQENQQNDLNKENATYLPMNARASGKIDDIDLKLKLLEMIAKEGKSDDSSSKEKALNEAVRKLLAPEKKSDDDQLDLLTALFKATLNEPKSQQSVSQENLKKLFKELNARPQSKGDDIDVESELRQLQKSINSLRPKEDPLFDNLGNNRRGKQDGDIQSMLSQIIAQNGGGATGGAGVDLAGAGPIDLSTVVNANGQSSISPGSLSLPNAGGKYTTPQLLQLSKILNTGGYNGGGYSYNAAGENSNPAVQQLLSQYLAKQQLNNYGSPQLNYGRGGTNLYSSSPNSNPYGPSSYSVDSSINSYGIGMDSYNPGLNAYNLNPNYGLGANSYSPNSNPYGPNSNFYSRGPYINLYNHNPNPYASNVHSYDSNLYGPSPNSYSYSFHPHGLNLYGPGPYSNSYSGPGSYAPSSNRYGQEGYGTSLNSGNMYPSSSRDYSGEPNLPHYTIPALPTYDVTTSNSNAINYPTTTNGYQLPSYPSSASEGYHNLGKNGYTSPGGIASKNYGSGGYSSSTNSYQGSAGDYSGVNQGSKAYYGSQGDQNTAGPYQNYGKGFFLSSGSSGNIGTSYQGNNYNSKSYGASSVDQPYSNDQTGDQYKFALASDLAKQIESLESAINGLSRHDYTQTAEDKATVASLEQKIYELKGVISSLDKPYSAQQTPYQNQQPYGSNPTTSYTQSPYNQQQSYTVNHAMQSYGGTPQNGGTLNAYGSSSQPPYQSSPMQIQPSNIPDHNSYSSYHRLDGAPQSSPAASSYPQTIYSNTSPPQTPSPQSYAGPQPKYPPNQSSNQNYSPSQTNSPNYSFNQPYNGSPQPQVDAHSSAAYQPLSHPQNSPSYQPKAALGEDRDISHEMSNEVHRRRSTGVKKSRRKRQVEDMVDLPMIPQMPPQMADADMTINVRQNYGGEGNRAVGYNFGDDALTQVANTFKKYLEENLTLNEENTSKQHEPTNNQESRNSAVAGLQEKLDFLKKQLESQRQSGRSLNDFFGPPGITNHIPLVPIPYGNNNYFSNNQHKAPAVTSLEKTFSDKKQDIFTQIVLKVLEKVLGTLPSVLPRLFGNLATTVGNSYGDSYSPLQKIFGNLGAVGYIPLILIKLLDSTSLIVQHLGKNKLFKSFLLPAGAVALAGMFILFLIYFYQQDEPYGYISYQGNNKYPQHDPNYYNHNSYSGTDYGNYRSNYGNNYDNFPSEYGYNYGNYRSDSYYSPNDRSNMQTPTNSNSNFYGNNMQIPYVGNFKGYSDFDGRRNFNSGRTNVPLQYSRGYYDYFDDRFMPYRNKNSNR